MSPSALFQFEASGRRYVLEGNLADMVPTPVQGIASADRVENSLVLTFFSETALSSSEGIRAYPSVTVSINAANLAVLCEQLNEACFTLFPEDGSSGASVKETDGGREDESTSLPTPADLSDPF